VSVSGSDRVATSVIMMDLLVNALVLTLTASLPPASKAFVIS
jgi:hypothetical protein